MSVKLRLPHPYVRHLASVGEGMVIEHQIDDHHH
ncbi:Hypothetical protein Asd1617_01060 [Shigella dysenteriae 1617]|uniref:Uncharacterized protein n=1 Tax=Shigella dysenteriae 1617 TaxID=754093 RepID=A0A0A6ZPI4_SHIDY|nr:Hypothetical protein Asd1617_01060 [Shigella dysenteriae 1617]